MAYILKLWDGALMCKNQKLDIERLVDDYNGLRIYMFNTNNQDQEYVLDTANCTVCTYRSIEDLFRVTTKRMYLGTNEVEINCNTFFEVVNSDLIEEVRTNGLIGQHPPQEYHHIVILAGNSTFELVTFKAPELKSVESLN